MAHESDSTWYHGAPLELDLLRARSTITQDRRLAEVFSHKPAVVSVSDDGQIKHTGNQAGWLYHVDEKIAPADIRPHPRSTMESGKEWLTNRPLRLALLGPVEIGPEEQLPAEALQELKRRAREYRPRRAEDKV